ncbi:inner nuclear membrane protein Man1 [Girardinichthys multiradiatus]|uniref:inner nuclear membrane protein Man1 n=1 Tax=Girardinichthys multiradiatus TaxID=208333 RepID=UPI001FAB66E6|nr:inner nuclear membrane protein Man1 [Girardinichthys multiradiatus]
MASTQLTDEELFSQLKCFGCTPGPITENTRPVYVKKLKKFREEQQKRGKGRGSGTSSSSTGASRPVRHDVRRLSSGRRPGLKSSVLGFSSDESDAETPLKRKGLDHLKRANRNPPVQQQQLKIRVTTPVNEANKKHHGVGTTLKSNSFPSPGGQTSASLGWEIGKRSRQDHESRDEDLSDEELQNSHPVNGSSAARVNTSKLAGEYSDSDEEEVGGPGGPDRDRRSLELRRIYSTGPFLSHVDGRGSRIGGKNCVLNPIGNRTMVGGREEDEEKERKGDLDALGGSRSHMFPRNSIYVSLDEDHQSKTGENNHVNSEEGTSRSNSAGRFSIGLRPRFPGSSSPTLTSKGGYPNHSPVPNHAYGPAAQKNKLAVPEDELLLQFKREEQVSSGSFSAHYLSMFLLTAACLFFLLLGLMYIRMRGSGSSGEDGVIKSHPFGSHFDSLYTKAEKDVILNLLLSLHEHLAIVAGHHDCGDQQYPKRSLSRDEVTEYLLAQNRDCKEFIDNSLEWIIRADQDVGIRLSGLIADDPVTDVSEISWLESTHPRMPFACRFRRALLTVTSKVLLVAVAVGFVWSVVCYVKYRWRREEEETRQMYDMVERIIDVLRTHGEACQENRDLEPYLPIPHVRDSLVQPKDRRKMQKIWDRAVHFLSANESRIRTETQKIKGADFLVWRWIQPPLSCDKSKVWQGKAFPLDRRNSPPNSLTPCLKIRNMFDPDMEVGDSWDLAIQEAILEKCSDNDGIVHISVDKNSKEGCVYVKCLSAEHSGKAFKALHGSWFDGKLVTVKYLRLDRYHQRFPQAQGCNTPLKASSLHQNPTNTIPCPLQHGPLNSSGFS